MKKETIIKVPKALVSFTTCTYCMGELVKQVNEYGNVKFQHGEVTINNFDHVYANMLIKGKQNLLRINCPHSNISDQRYYLRGYARLHLGQKMIADIHHYRFAGLYFQQTSRNKRKLIRRYGHLIYHDDSDLSDWSTE